MVTASRKQRAVFLDRDGVLNRALVINGKSYPPKTLDGFELLEGVEAACVRMKAAGLLLIVVTNQPDVRTGKQEQSVVDAMHQRLREWLPIDDVFACLHIDGDNCSCRKPRPGMLLAAAEKHGIDLDNSFIVGDRWRDIEAGQAVGCQSYFIEYGYNEPGPQAEFTVVTDLVEASELICRAIR